LYIVIDFLLLKDAEISYAHYTFILDSIFYIYLMEVIICYDAKMHNISDCCGDILDFIIILLYINYFYNYFVGCKF